MRPSTVGATTSRPAGEVRQARPHGHGCLSHRLLTPGFAQRDRIVQSTYAGLPHGGSSWSSVAKVLHNGGQLAAGSSLVSRNPTAGEVITTDGGTDAASGSWVIRIDELVGDGPQGQIRLEGPWEITFAAP
jgi:hypothetical protein